MLSLVLDLAVVLVFVFFVIFGIKKGFIRSLISFLGASVSIFLAFHFSAVISKFIFNFFVEPAIIGKVESALKSSNLHTPGEILKSVPRFFLMSGFGAEVTPERINDVIINNGTSVIPGKVAGLFEPAVTNVLRVILTALLFFIFMVLIRFLGKFVSKIFKLPILRQADGFLGGIFGFLKCCVFLFLVTLCLRFYLSSNISPSEIFSENSIKSSVIFKQIYECSHIKQIVEPALMA